ncbi:MAG TPA: hypothetical protein VGN11_02835 [Candidatus Baltobacteraceae bacterium]|jgi:predicted Zn-dependent peptidase|nr:hypothetical protein [Candidatus Baltobacteraceae bacterium]
MNARPFAVGLMLLAASLAPVYAPAADQVPRSGTLPHGGSYVLSTDTTIAAAAIDLWFRAPGAGYDDALPGIARLAATAVASAPLESGKSLVALVRSAGGRLSINAYPDIVGISVIVPATAARRIVAAITSAYFAPSFDDNALKVAQRDMAVLGVQKRYSSDQLLHDDLFATIFSEGPAHYPSIPMAVSDLTKVSLSDATTFAKRAFRSGNATLTLTGNIDASVVGAVTAGSGGSMDAPHQSQPAPSPLARATAAAAVSGTGIAWVGPAIADERSATAMDFIADYLFRDDTGLVSASVDSPESYVSGQFITLHDPGVMLVTVGGDKASDATQRVLDAVAKMEQPLDAAAFAAAREAFLYHLASDTQLPQQQADNLGWYATEGNLPYAPSTADSAYWSAARSLDPAFVASIAKRYLGHPVVVQLQPATPTKESAS